MPKSVNQRKTAVTTNFDSITTRSPAKSYFSKLTLEEERNAKDIERFNQ